MLKMNNIKLYDFYLSKMTEKIIFKIEKFFKADFDHDFEVFRIVTQFTQFRHALRYDILICMYIMDQSLSLN